MSHWHQRFPSNNYQAVERKVTRPFINAFVGDVPPQAACVCGGTLTSTVGLWRRRAFLESCVLLGGSDGRIRLQTLGHFVADDIHKTLKRLLDINVILGTCFKKFKPWKKQTQLGHFILLLKVNETWLWFFLVIVGDLRLNLNKCCHLATKFCSRVCWHLFMLPAWLNEQRPPNLFAEVYLRILHPVFALPSSSSWPPGSFLESLLRQVMWPIFLIPFQIWPKLLVDLFSLTVII